MNNGWDDATHEVLCWGSGGDRSIFTRISAGGDEPVVDLQPRREKPVDVYSLVKTAIRSDRWKAKFSLADVHAALCPDVTRRFHIADDDVQATIDIVLVLLNL